MPPTRPFSKLKKQVEALFVPSLKMEVNCISYPIRSQYGSSSIPRFYVRLNKEIIWDFPKDFPIKNLDYHYWKDSTVVSELLREYMDTPINELLNKTFGLENIGTLLQHWGEKHREKYDFNLELTDLLKAADRRIGKEKLITWGEEKSNPKIRMILEKRFEKLME